MTVTAAAVWFALWCLTGALVLLLAIVMLEPATPSGSLARRSLDVVWLVIGWPGVAAALGFAIARAWGRRG